MLEFIDCLRFEDYNDAIRYVTRMFNMILEGTNSYGIKETYWKWHYCKINSWIPFRLMMTLDGYGFDMGYQKELFHSIIVEASRSDML